MEHVEENQDTTMDTSKNAPVSYYGDNGMGSGAGAALLAGIATRDYYNPVDSISANGICDLRHEVGEVKERVKDAEAEIRRDVAKAEADIRSEVLKEGQENMAATKDAECSLSKEILETRHTLAKDILRSEYENKLAIQAAIKEINEKVDKESERTNDKVDFGFRDTTNRLTAFEKSVDAQFCSVHREIEECCCELKLNAVNAQLKTAEQVGLVNLIVEALNAKK